MIGQGGQKLIGKFAQRNKLEAGKKLAPCQIVEVQMVKGKPGKYEYGLKIGSFRRAGFVRGDDADWDLVELKTDDREEAVKVFLRGRMSPAIEGNVATWLGGDETADRAISECVRMDCEVRSSDALKYLWSGGAADCVIVAAYSPSKKSAYLTHATRASAKGAAAALLSMGSDALVYLSSQIFALSLETASTHGTVQEVCEMLRNEKITPVGCFGSGRLAINSMTGDVFSKFENPVVETE